VKEVDLTMAEPIGEDAQKGSPSSFYRRARGVWPLGMSGAC